MLALKIVVWLVCATGGAGLFLLIVPFWVCWSVWQGLMLRSRTPVELLLANGVVMVRAGSRRHWVLLSKVCRARLALNGNWTESTLVEDALTVFDAKGRTLAKIPMSAACIDELFRTLEDRHIRIERVEVSAPGYLD